MHDPKIETSIWLLAGSTRLMLESIFNPLIFFNAIDPGNSESIIIWEIKKLETLIHWEKMIETIVSFGWMKPPIIGASHAELVHFWRWLGILWSELIKIGRLVSPNLAMSLEVNTVSLNSLLSKFNWRRKSFTKGCSRSGLWKILFVNFPFFLNFP